MKTDIQVQQDVIDELKWEQSIDASKIGVEVTDGVVTLAGHVDSYSEKWSAESAAQRVAGVKALAVEIDVKLPGSSSRTDADIARAAQNVLEWNTYLPNDRITVKVEGAWITLAGEVDWDYQRHAAISSVSHLMGIKGVSDQISLRPAIPSDSIKTQIEGALGRRSKASAHKIHVDVHDSNVTLSGTVDNWADREAARRTAWGTPGVHKVNNNISIAW